MPRASQAASGHGAQVLPGSWAPGWVPTLPAPAAVGVPMRSGEPLPQQEGCRTPSPLLWSHEQWRQDSDLRYHSSVPEAPLPGLCGAHQPQSGRLTVVWLLVRASWEPSQGPGQFCPQRWATGPPFHAGCWRSGAGLPLVRSVPPQGPFCQPGCVSVTRLPFLPHVFVFLFCLSFLSLYFLVLD